MPPSEAKSAGRTALVGDFCNKIYQKRTFENVRFPQKAALQVVLKRRPAFLAMASNGLT